MFLEKKNKTKISEFYPKVRMFHYINHNFFNDENNNTIIAQMFYKNTGYYPSINNPQTFNEKILWLNQYYHNPLATCCADKYQIKEYVKKQTGEDLSIPVLKTYKSIYDVNLNELPNKFVLKINWGKGDNSVIIVKDKTKVSIDEIRVKMDDWLQQWNNAYFENFDYAYKNMKPIIYAEEYVDEINREMNSYKIYCFNGKAKFVKVVGNKLKKGKITKTFFDNEWNKLPVKDAKSKINKTLSKPKQWNKMIDIAEQLAQPFPFVVVDFYNINEKFYVGKMEFYIEKNFEVFEPKEWDLKFGNELQLPEKCL